MNEDLGHRWNPTKVVCSRRMYVVSACIGALSFFSLLYAVNGQTPAAKQLKLKNATTQAIEYGLRSPGQPPLTTIVVQPGQTRILYPVPGRDALWYRYYGTSSWAAPYTIPFNPDAVYKWKFIPSGSMPGVVGAPELP